MTTMMRAWKMNAARQVIAVVIRTSDQRPGGGADSAHAD